MANRINVNGIELTREETFPTIAVAEPKVEETVVEEVKKTKKGKKGKKAMEEVVEPTIEETEVTEETTDKVADEPKDEE